MTFREIIRAVKYLRKLPRGAVGGLVELYLETSKQVDEARKDGVITREELYEIINTVASSEAIRNLIPYAWQDVIQELVSILISFEIAEEEE